ncbi:hypothetical protein P154DRAFT_483706 [Amniculicola lignicola CBS 123094]|uniref:Uncharacterized protein n=1 Tax=Amniculicola lignicola CBS 123094 TaxID=1392246 RepID=A0A6A5WTJ5_9PLEO|nr:hypothetical protein P154DRAFT_483706 [Amniculicola lignicola CBS 123094]
MELQAPLPAPAASPATPRLLHQHQQRGTETDTEYTYNEKDAYPTYPSNSRTERGSKGSNGRGHDSVISHPFSPKASAPPSQRSSVSSNQRKHRSMSEIQNAPVTLSYPQQAHLGDPEKGSDSAHGRRSSNRASNPAVIYDSGEYHEKGPEERTVQLLLYLSGPCALLSVLITFWTMLSLFVAILLQPFRACTARPSLSTQVTTFLAPPLNLQLHLVYSVSSSTEYSPAMLVVVHLFSPVVAFGVAVAAWTAAFFWFFSAILGDPAGQDGHNDGKDSILGVRRWWDRWLSRALR